MSATLELKPRSRTRSLVTEDVGDEVMVYKLNEHKALRLNAMAAQVWRRCDGATAIPEIASDLSKDTGEDVPVELVEYTVARLSKASLLDGERGSVTSGINRRQLLGRLGIAAGALPVVFSLTAPRAFAQGSPLCITHVQCQTGGFPCGTTCTNVEISQQNCVKSCHIEDMDGEWVCEDPDKLDLSQPGC